MRSERVRAVGMGGTLAWLVVAAYGVRTALVDDGENWELSYALFSVALVAAVILTMLVAGWWTRTSMRPRLRTAGLVVCGVGAALSFVAAWAVLLWAAVLGAGLGLVALACVPDRRGPMVVLPAGQLLGLAVMVLGLVAEVGRQDEWNDYPVPGGVGLAVVALITAAGLVRLTRRSSTVPA